ncbi:MULTISPECIES: glycerophosphodiester phosphodiesterase family protein [unclassified Paenibacillus]|uniref:glycerophosphodiester phosphodiesterase family protein n=1 Tax=unclassified Paenibacillus TaxID=185978 RepID=UPI004047832F
MDYGAEVIEFDVKLTKANILAVFHDSTCWRNCVLKIRNYNIRRVANENMFKCSTVLAYAVIQMNSIWNRIS